MAFGDRARTQRHAGTFAYCKTEPAPVVHDEATDTFRPVNDAVVAAENVGVMFAPIYACFSHDILDRGCNALSRSALLGWAAVANKLMVWSYASNLRRLSAAV